MLAEKGIEFVVVSGDMIEGTISGTVNLVTRKPLDKPGTRIAGTVEANYGDFAEKGRKNGFSAILAEKMAGLRWF